jgi:hypothetical protein
MDGSLRKDGRSEMATVKTVDNRGQISLGKEFGGRDVFVDQIEKKVWIIKPGAFVPDSEAWLLDLQVSAKFDKAIAWAAKSPRGNYPRMNSKEECRFLSFSGGDSK